MEMIQLETATGEAYINPVPALTSGASLNSIVSPEVSVTYVGTSGSSRIVLPDFFLI